MSRPSAGRGNRRAHAESGFTLIELLLVVVMLGIIIAPLTAGLMVGLRTTEETANRLSGSNDAQILSTWLPPDIQSTGNQAGDVVFSPTADTECSGISNRLRLRWRETQGSTTDTYVVAYAIVASGDGRWFLRRYVCVNAGAAVSNVVSRNLAGSTATSVTSSGTKVSMTVTEAPSTTDPSNYTFTVSGNRRTV